MNKKKTLWRWVLGLVSVAVLIMSVRQMTASRFPHQSRTRVNQAAHSEDRTQLAARRLAATSGTESSVHISKKTSATTTDERDEDFRNAMYALLESEEKLLDQRGLFELGYRWVEVDPEKALAFVQSLPFENGSLLIALVNHWTRHDPVSAAAWARRLSDEATRRRAVVSLTAVWAENAPIEAARFAASLDPGAAQNEAVVTAISGWAQQDPRAALAWVGQFSPGELQQQLYTQVLFAWGQHDPVAAAEWVATLPNTPVRDRAASALSGSLAERYPAAALALAADISDESIRDQRIKNVSHRWLETDRAAAESTLVESDLPLTTVVELLR